MEVKREEAIGAAYDALIAELKKEPLQSSNIGTLVSTIKALSPDNFSRERGAKTTA